jgi:hypothetical protein
MLGLIHNTLEAFAIERFGDEAWERVLDGATLQTPGGVYTSLGYYPDADLLALVGSACRVARVEPAVLLRDFGEYLLGQLAARYPAFFEQHAHPKAFLRSVDGRIHVEVRKLYPDVGLPAFEYEDPADDRLVMIYRSRRQLCSLAEGLIKGAIHHYGRDADVQQTACTAQGADACRFEIRFVS